MATRLKDTRITSESEIQMWWTSKGRTREELAVFNACRDVTDCLEDFCCGIAGPERGGLKFYATRPTLRPIAKLSLAEAAKLHSQGKLAEWIETEVAIARIKGVEGA